jgi:hypothetical protein
VGTVTGAARQIHLDRLDVLDGFVRAFEQGEQVHRLIASAPSRFDAIPALMERFAFSEVQAMAVLDLPVYRFAQRERGLVEQERDELRRALKASSVAAGPLTPQSQPIAVDRVVTAGLSDEGMTYWEGLRRAPQRVRVPWFEDVLTGMAGAPNRIAGVVHARVSDDGGAEFSYRVVRDGYRVRCSALDGAVHVVAGHDTVWFRRDDPARVVTKPIRQGFVPVPDDYDFGVRPFDWDRWNGDDFTTPIGGPEEVVMLGRPAWRITLAPPPHKPEPIQMVVEQQTFLVLRRGNQAFGTYREWIELDLDPDIDEDQFTWRDQDRLAERYQ